jgi:hypothetical protein
MGSATVPVAAVGVSPTASAARSLPNGSSFAHRNVFSGTPKTAGDYPKSNIILVREVNALVRLNDPLKRRSPRLLRPVLKKTPAKTPPAGAGVTPGTTTALTVWVTCE